MKNKPYMFVFDGKLMECESLLQLKSHASSDDWRAILSQSADFFMQLYAIYKSNRPDLQLEKRDKSIMRSLKRTMLMVQKIDPATYNEVWDIDKINEYNKIAAEEASQAEAIYISYNGKLNGANDIIVDSLD
jgi:hypothetical protein